MKKTVFVLASTVASLTASREAFAFRKFLGQFSEHYSANNISTDILTSEQSCGLCHVRAGGGGTRNPYGVNFQNVALSEGSGFPGIEFLDSDKDGFPNLEEIFLQTAPGKIESLPAGRIALEVQETNALIVRPAVGCGSLKLKAFGFTFENGSSELELLNVGNESQITLSGDAGAILARCDAEKLTGSLQR